MHWISPTTAQWITVVCYVLASTIWYVRCRAVGATSAAWLGTVLLLVLGSDRLWWWNHSLADAIRQLARSSDWYELRSNYQLAGIFAVGVVAIGTMGMLFLRAPRTAWRTMPLIATFAFCVARAASQHELDRWFVTPLCGLRIHWWIELGLLAWIIAAAVIYPMKGNDLKQASRQS